jgi:hypothetical protein
VSVVGTGGLLFVALLLMILFRRKYPRWWFDFNLELQRFANRTATYLVLMDAHYPSTDDQQSVRLDYRYPDPSRELNRWLPLVKWPSGVVDAACGTGQRRAMSLERLLIDLPAGEPPIQDGDGRVIPRVAATVLGIATVSTVSWTADVGARGLDRHDAQHDQADHDDPK